MLHEYRVRWQLPHRYRKHPEQMPIQQVHADLHEADFRTFLEENTGLLIGFHAMLPHIVAVVHVYLPQEVFRRKFHSWFNGRYKALQILEVASVDGFRATHDEFDDEDLRQWRDQARSVQA